MYTVQEIFSVCKFIFIIKSLDLELEELNIEDPEYYPECNGHVPNLTTNEDGRFVINWGQDFLNAYLEKSKRLSFLFLMFVL